MVKTSTELFDLSSPLFITLALLFLIIAILANLIILNKDKDIDGSGIPSMKIAIRKKLNIKWYKDIPLLIVNSFVSTFIGFPLGSEGPSVVLASKISYGVDSLLKKEKYEDAEIAEGAGFGCAFLSPLAGLCYSLEESLGGKINIRILIKSVFIIIIAFIFTSFINKNHLLILTQDDIFSSENFYVFPLLMVINIIISLFFIKLMLVLRLFFMKHNKNKLVKFRSIPLFILVFILNIYLLAFMQSGGKLIQAIDNYTNLFIVIGILIFRIILTSLCGSGSVTGGLVIPIIAIGAINGQIVNCICSNLFSLDPIYFDLVTLISGTMMFAFTIETPFTSIALVSSVIFFTTQNFSSISEIIIPLAFFTLFGCYIMKHFFKQESLYEGMINVNKKVADITSTTSQN